MSNLLLAMPGGSEILVLVSIPVIIFFIGFFIGKNVGYNKRVKEEEKN